MMENTQPPSELQQHQEVCCWRFAPVVVLGREGAVVLTAKRLLFAAQQGRRSSSSGGVPDGGSNEESTKGWEVLLQFPLAAWTSTERSKKAAKARMSYVARAGAAAGGAAGTDGGVAVQSVVFDFVGMREKMDLCCRSLQTLASAARTVQSRSSFLCPLDTTLLLQLLQLPEDTPLRIAPELLQQQELQKQEIEKQQVEQQEQQEQVEQQQADAPSSASTDTLSTAPAAAPGAGERADAKQQQLGVTRPPHKTVRQKAATAKTHSLNASSTAAKAATEAPSAADAAAAAVPASEVPSWEALQKQQRQREAEQLKQLQQQLLEQNPEMLAVYQTLVRDSAGRDPQQGLTAEEFWRLHQHQLLALRPQPAPENVSAAFLSRPPQYHLEGQQQRGDPQGSGELVVDCSEQMLSQILKEDPTIRAAYSSLVATGRMGADRFWGRVFRSKYFQAGIGLPERQQEVNDEEASAFIASYLKEARVSARDALSLPGIEKTLLSDADLRVRGFGLPDGLSSLAGDLAEKQPTAGSAASAAAASATSSLIGRFNRHSQRLLLQQVLQPAAAAAAANDEAAPRDQVQLVVQQDQQLRRRAAAAAVAGVPAANPNDAATLGCGVMADEAPLLAALRLEELDEVCPTKYHTLGVSRRQLYAAGARGPKNPITGAAATADQAPSAAASCASRSAGLAHGTGQGEAGDAAAPLLCAQEAEAAQAWLCLQGKQAKRRNSGALQSAEVVAAVYETGRYMFVFNTKLCQKDKAAQVATLDYEASTVNAVRARQARVGELLRHFYSTTLPEDKKRTRLVEALDAIRAELENSQDFAGGFTGAATKALSAPLVEQITAARRHAGRLQRLLQAAREKRATQQGRNVMQQQQQQQLPSAGSNVGSVKIVPRRADTEALVLLIVATGTDLSPQRPLEIKLGNVV
ncbi:hypothetical protein Efla_003168 [Eimeria flavescens]